MQIFNKPYQSLLNDIKSILVQKKQFLAESHADGKDQALLDDLLFQLDDLFLLVVAGEFNSGKSAFINALLGQAVLDTGITPTTADITILRYGPQQNTSRSSKGQLVVEIPNPLLSDISIVDTPGTNAILREHEVLTSDFIPRSDLVLFITSVDRPFTESERLFLESIQEWGKKIVLVINKSDIVEHQSDIEKVTDFVKQNAIKLLGTSPQVFIISAKEALKAKVEHNKPDKSFEELEDYIFKTLDTPHRTRLKLGNPLGILTSFILKYSEINSKQRDLILDDLRLLDDIEKQSGLFREDMLRAYKFRYAEIDNTILQFEKRGVDFFEATFRINRVLDLLNKDLIKNEFNTAVVNNLPREIDDKVTAMIEWLVEENQKQWQIITRKINQRSSIYQDRLLHDPETESLSLQRQKIIGSINREAQRIVEQYDKENEASQIAEEAQMAVAASAAVEVGAIGLGTLVTILATTASADLTGIMLAGLAATLGFMILPAKKRQIKSLFSKNIGDLRAKLADSLLKEFSGQVDYVLENIHTTILPYSRFIRTEDEKLSHSAAQLKALSNQSEALKTRVEQL